MTISLQDFSLTAKDISNRWFGDEGDLFGYKRGVNQMDNAYPVLKSSYESV